MSNVMMLDGMSDDDNDRDIDIESDDVSSLCTEQEHHITHMCVYIGGSVPRGPRPRFAGVVVVVALRCVIRRVLFGFCCQTRNLSVYISGGYLYL